VTVDAACISQTCASCGVVDLGSRGSQAIFCRIACGHRDHADVSAAQNVLRRWTTAHLPRDRVGDSGQQELLKRGPLRLELLGAHAGQDSKPESAPRLDRKPEQLALAERENGSVAQVCEILIREGLEGFYAAASSAPFTPAAGSRTGRGPLCQAAQNVCNFETELSARGAARWPRLLYRRIPALGPARALGLTRRQQSAPSAYRTQERDHHRGAQVSPSKPLARSLSGWRLHVAI
jgi:Putative transposase DNA-binding domain